MIHPEISQQRGEQCQQSILRTFFGWRLHEVTTFPESRLMKLLEDSDGFPQFEQDEPKPKEPP